MKQDFYKLVDIIYSKCSRETCYPKVAEKWSEDNRFYGHCAIVSLLLNDFYGGKIVKCKLKEENVSHYYNVINNEDIDITANQYNYTPTKTDIRYVARDEILSDKNTLSRYEKLKNTVKSF